MNGASKEPSFFLSAASHMGHRRALSSVVPVQDSRKDRTWSRGRAVFAVLLPGLLVLAADAFFRREIIPSFDRVHLLGYMATWLVSCLLWGAAILGATGPARRLGVVVSFAFIAIFALCLGAQGGFFATWKACMTRDTFVTTTKWRDMFFGALPARSYVPWTLAAGVIGVGIVAFARRSLAPSMRMQKGAAVAFPVCLALVSQVPVSYRPPQSTLPDINYLHGMAVGLQVMTGRMDGLRVHRMQRRIPESIPRLSPKPAAPRNVILLIQESTRYDAVCVEYEANCKRPGRSTNPVVPNRMPLLQMRSNDSATLISESTLFSAVDPTSPEELMLRVPYIWDVAAQAGYDTAYWTSQNVLVSGHRFFTQDSPLRIQVVASHLQPTASIANGATEKRLVDRVIADLKTMREPFFAAVQFSATHQPYWVDKKDAPFKEKLKTENGSRLSPQYQNAVYASDKQVARLVQAIRKSKNSDRTVIIYTSDHGESFGKHVRGGHTNSLFESEIRVPTWIDAPSATLNEAERASIQGAKGTPLWHVDLGATLFDLVGVWDLSEFQPVRDRMLGHPITRPERTTGPVAITNCSWVWGCKQPNFGMMQGYKKLFAGYFDKGPAFTCFDLEKDPWEDHPLEEAACGDLAAFAHRTYPKMPNELPRIVGHEW